MASTAILDFQNLKLLTVNRLERAELRRRTKFGRNRSNCGRDMAIFRFFKMAAAAILDFQNLKLLTMERLERADLRRSAKFGRNRSNHGRHMVNFRFFKMASAAMLDLLCACLDHPRRVFGGLYHCAKFGWNRCSSFDNMHIFRF